MKRTVILIALVGLLIMSIERVFYWDNGLSTGRQDSAQNTAILNPAAFANLSPSASSAQYAERIHALGRNVPQQEQIALIAWINGPKPANFSDSIWHFLVNEVMDNLCRQNHPLPSWSDVLIGIARGKANDPTLRDYAVQHMVDWIQPVNLGEPCETDPQKRQAMILTMLDAARQTWEGISGTAVLGLHIILQGRQRSQQQNDPSVQLPLPLTGEQLRPLAINLAAAKDGAPTARTTAFQVCAERGFKEALSAARTTAIDQNQPTSLRISAIAAIGQLGNDEDELLLQKLQAEKRSHLLAAIKPALKRIKHRADIAHSITIQ